MDLKSKVLLGILSLSVVLSVSSLFYKTVILQDFDVIDSSEEEGSLDEETTDDTEVLDEEIPTEDVGTQDSPQESEVLEENIPPTETQNGDPVEIIP